MILSVVDFGNNLRLYRIWREGYMKREDHDLAFMLRYENIASIDDGCVRILDRRVYPNTIRFEVCHSVLDVRNAIKNMVTQSAGPYTAVGMGMALAARECRTMNEEETLIHLKEASHLLSTARPTTEKRYSSITESCIPVALKAKKEGKSPEKAVKNHVYHLNDLRYKKIKRISEYLCKEIPDNGAVMTQCFGETIVGMMARTLKEEGKSVRFFCPETRPYFQGARLTATVLSEMGFHTTVITDNMPAFVMKNESIDVFTCAADAITMDGYVVNKVGTLGIAICAKHFGVKTYITGDPDKFHKSIDEVKIEMRDPKFSLEAMGVKTAKDGVKGYYPAFDITPPSLITGIVTDMGIYNPFNLESYFLDGGEGEY